jgi:hypothetical protein
LGLWSLDPSAYGTVPKQIIEDGGNNVDKEKNMQLPPSHVFLIIVTVICCLLQKSLGFTNTAYQRAVNGLIHQLVVVL